MPDDRVASQHYSRVAIALHWLIVALLVVQFSIAFTMPEITKNTVPQLLINWHLSTGIIILIVMVGRLFWRITHVPPAAPEDLSPPLKMLSRGTHYLLYCLLVAMPLLGWANASARNWSVTVFGIVPLPRLVSAGSTIGRQAGDIHATLAIVLLVTIALHISGALYHRFVLRDRTLARMI